MRFWHHSPDLIDQHGFYLSGFSCFSRSCLQCLQVCKEAVSDGAGLLEILKLLLVCSSSTEPSDWFRPWMSVLTDSLAKSNGDDGGCQHRQSLQFMPQERPLVVTVLQLLSLWLRPWTNVCRSSLSLELLLNGKQCTYGHTSGLKTALMDLKGRINPAVARNAISLEECQLFCPPGLYSGI